MKKFIKLNIFSTSVSSFVISFQYKFIYFGTIKFIFARANDRRMYLWSRFVQNRTWEKTTKCLFLVKADTQVSHTCSPLAKNKQAKKRVTQKKKKKTFRARGGGAWDGWGEGRGAFCFHHELKMQGACRCDVFTNVHCLEYRKYKKYIVCWNTAQREHTGVDCGGEVR